MCHSIISLYNNSVFWFLFLFFGLVVHSDYELTEWYLNPLFTFLSQASKQKPSHPYQPCLAGGTLTGHRLFTLPVADHRSPPLCCPFFSSPIIHLKLDSEYASLMTTHIWFTGKVDQGLCGRHKKSASFPCPFREWTFCTHPC